MVKKLLSMALTFLFASSLPIGCKNSKGQKKSGGTHPVTPAPAPSENQTPQPPVTAGPPHTVMVIDDGFDVNHPVFKGKIAAAYTITCDESSDGFQDPEPTTYEELRLQVLESLKKRDDSCHLEKNVTVETNPDLPKVQSNRDPWNEAVENKQIGGLILYFEMLAYNAPTAPKPEKVGSLSTEEALKTLLVLDGYSAEGEYLTEFHQHGTMTAGTVAYQNPNVKLVLVHMDLGGPSQARSNVTAKAGDDDDDDDDDSDQSDCPSQESFDLEAQLMEDQQVLDAISKQPARVDEELGKIMREHGVTLVNKSYGANPASMLEQEFADQGCKVSLHKWVAAQAKMEAARAKYLVDSKTMPRVLNIRAAGNESTLIDTVEEGSQCVMPDEIEVGSVDYNKQRSAFSNYGKCVDTYIGGEDLVLAVPGGFLKVASGTSFSSPAFARYITLNYPSTFNIDQMLTKFKGSNTVLGYEAIPKELFADVNTGIGAYALVGKRKVKAYKLPTPLARSPFHRIIGLGKKLGRRKP
ncbi:MAG: S8 family serine peptidase [Oligoflexales bacterium]